VKIFAFFFLLTKIARGKTVTYAPSPEKIFGGILAGFLKQNAVNH